MPFAITRSCCNDAHCVSVCPVNCIHPTPDEPDFGTTDQLYVDPRACIDCGACASACPVDAVFPVEELTAPLAHFAGRNAAFYADRPVGTTWAAPRFPRALPAGSDLRVAVVGTGPAACYAAQTLLRSTEARLTLVEREDVPGGLVRWGVAPDHPSTKRVADVFAWIFRHPRVTLRLGTEVGRDVGLDELRATHHAVLVAVGASDERRLGIPGEHLPGVVAGGDLARWANGHPAAPAPDLTRPRAVVVGTGNVALDVARLLASDPDDLGGDLDPHVRAALRRSAVREVVVVGRRGPSSAAWTESELLALKHLPGVRLVVDDVPGVGDEVAAGAGPAAHLQDVDREAVSWDTDPVGRRIVLRFGSAPRAVLGGSRVQGLALADGTDLRAGLVVTSIGRTARGLPGMPVDAAGAVAQESGRVLEAPGGGVVPGLFVAGWAKRGGSGGIGANRRDAEETVAALVDDALAGRLPAPTAPPPLPLRRRLLRLR
ncbi:FAD-dependent oxidoreductase [Lapillicoccus jejuensis]|uniref:ferredoxin--NADP(+) reductase n=1 Tax=Lapillicoccus jejuensis TaxID=402171 RepID=A0A542DY26_9MICO|nr:FAD-dependent oxidoreductase [Lapillicoccus jejuensis]TQJ08002.1 ferredoxin--NADP+ reductase [Lapillicoccus jejuensis]